MNFSFVEFVSGKSNTSISVLIKVVDVDVVVVTLVVDGVGVVGVVDAVGLGLVGVGRSSADKLINVGCILIKVKENKLDQFKTLTFYQTMPC